MSEKNVGIAAVLAATMLMTVFTTVITLSMNYAEGQPIPPCPVGFHRNAAGICVPDVIPPPNTLPTNENKEQNIVCSGFSYTCG